MRKLTARLLLGLAIMLPGAVVSAGDASLPSDARIYQWMSHIAGLGVREPGSQASRDAARYVHDHFVASGLEDVQYEPAQTLVWNADHFRLSIEGQSFPASPMLHTFHKGEPGSFATPEGGLEAELVYVGNGSASQFWFRDVKDKIVVANVSFGNRPLWLFKPFLLGIQDSEGTFGPGYSLTDPYGGGTFPDSYYRAMENGAAGFIGVLEDYFDSHTYRNEAYRSYRPGQAMEIPGVWLSPVDGSELIEQLKSRWWGWRPMTARLEMEGRLTTEEARGVIGYLPGQTDDILLVQSHHDSATEGATEDASGTSVILALARYFAKIPQEERRKTLLFATMDSHFTDYAVHKKFVERHIAPGNPLQENILAAVTIEHIAREVLPGQNLQPETTGLLAPRVMMVTDEVAGLANLATDVIGRYQLDRTLAVPTSLVQWLEGGGIPADSSQFLRAGLPVIAFVGAPLYLYDEIDTVDKVPADELGRVSHGFAELIHRLDEFPADQFVRIQPQPNGE